jgi:hypothetical protein
MYIMTNVDRDAANWLQTTQNRTRARESRRPCPVREPERSEGPCHLACGDFCGSVSRVRTSTRTFSILSVELGTEISPRRSQAPRTHAHELQRLSHKARGSRVPRHAATMPCFSWLAYAIAGGIIVFGAFQRTCLPSASPQSGSGSAHPLHSTDTTGCSWWHTGC